MNNSARATIAEKIKTLRDNAEYLRKTIGENEARLAKSRDSLFRTEAEIAEHERALRLIDAAAPASACQAAPAPAVAMPAVAMPAVAPWNVPPAAPARLVPGDGC